LWIDGNNILRRSNFVASFAVPLMIDGESNYDSILLLRHFCGETGSNKKNSCKALLQSLLLQLLKQRPTYYERKRSAISRDCTKRIDQLWLFLVNCFREVKAQCTFIIIDSIDHAYEESESFSVVEKLTSLVKEENFLIKILLTARLAENNAPTTEARMELVRTVPHRRSTVIYDQSFALTPLKLLQMQEGSCKDVLFTDIIGLYLPNTTIYTIEDGHLRAFLVQELEPPQPRSFGTFTPTMLRALYIDHDGSGFVKRACTLTIPQFSGTKAIKDLQYVPAGFLEDEAKQRSMLRRRGLKFWSLCQGVHFRICQPDSGRVVIHQASAPRSTENTEYRLPDMPASSLKPLTLILCAPTISAFLLDELRWSKSCPYHLLKLASCPDYFDEPETVAVDTIQEIHYSTDAMDHLILPLNIKSVLLSSLQAYFTAASSENIDVIRAKKRGIIGLLHGPPSTGKTMTVGE
jgi:hypothetical protein